MKLDDYRVGTLKRCEVELLDISETEEITIECKASLQNLVRQIRIALGEEIGCPRTK